jgi:integrase
MVETGLRREEAAGLACAMLPAPSGSSNAMLRMTLDPTKTPTKGGKARWVQMSPQLYAALWQYREVERPRLAMLYRQKHAGVTDRLFLNRYGDPLSLQGLDNVFRKASDRSGIHCTPHMLRHTFGTYELLRLEKVMNQGNALLWVKERMGHSSIQTTMRYLHLAVVAGQDTLDDYQEAITSMMAEVCRG